MRSMFAKIVGAMTVLAATLTANAYVTHGRWSGNEVTMRASSVSFPSGSSYRTALGTITSRFYSNPSEMWFTQSYDDTSIGFDNGQSEVWFSADSAYDPAVTFWWNDWLTGDIEEADCVFYNGESYTTSMNKTSLWTYGGSYRPFQTTAIHEYGHAAGLSHENDEYNIMGQDWSHISCNGSTARSYVGEDACDGLVALYGLASGGTFEDVSVTLMKYLGTSGEYSTHQLGKMYTSTGGSLSSGSFNGQRRYNVTKGSRYQAEFTWENNGETTQTRNVAFYISTNSTISTGDTLIGTGSVGVSRGNVSTTKTTLTIPSTLTSGTTYYLGVIIDYNGALTETDESNNAAYHIIKIN